MWVLNYIVCVIRRHIFATMFLDNSPYHYCLRCGKVKLGRVASAMVK